MTKPAANPAGRGPKPPSNRKPRTEEQKAATRLKREQNKKKAAAERKVYITAALKKYEEQLQAMPQRLRYTVKGRGWLPLQPLETIHASLKRMQPSGFVTTEFLQLMHRPWTHGFTSPAEAKQFDEVQKRCQPQLDQEKKWGEQWARQVDKIHADFIAETVAAKNKAETALAAL